MDFYSSTWGSWDVRCLNALMKVPEMVEVRVLGYDCRSRAITEEMRWESLVRFGAHAVDNSYSDVTLKIGAGQFRMESAAEADGFVFKITPLRPDENMRFFVAGLYRWNAPGQLERLEDRLVFRTGDKTFTVTVVGTPETLPINTTYPGLLLDGRETIYIRCNHSMNPEEMDALLQQKAAAWKRQSLQGGGFLADAPQAMIQGIAWNTIFEAIKKRFCTPVTREWCILKPERPWFGSYVLFTWDTSFNALLAACQDESLAYRQIYSLIEDMTEENIPCTSSEVNVYADRSQLPITSYCALKLYHQFGNLDFLRKVFQPLLVHHGWWFKYRDGNGDGLLEWGTNWPVTHTDYQGYLNLAMAESGLDNSPMFDDTCFNPQTHTMEQTDVGLNAIYALDAWALAEIASRLGLENEARVLRDEFAVMKERINRELWNEALGIYCNRHWDGRFNPVLGPTCFYPMLAGIAAPEQAARMVRDHLLNEAEFWGEFVIPASPMNHPSFADNDYWRGRIWAPTNFLVAEGLKRGGYYDTAYAVARKSLNLFLQEWNNESHIHENYHTLTGDGDDVYNADPVYTWGGLLAYLGLNEVIEVQPEGGLRLGNLGGAEGMVENFLYQGKRYTVTTGAQLTVRVDGRMMIETTMPVRITRLVERDGVLSFALEAQQTGTVTVHQAGALTECDLVVNGAARRMDLAAGRNCVSVEGSRDDH